MAKPAKGRADSFKAIAEQMKTEREIVMTLAFECGYKACERNENIQFALEEFRKIFA